jgi:glutathione S-transferase
MHSGFAALRRDLSMNLRRRVRIGDVKEDTAADIARIEELWADLRARHGAHGPWLFGARSIADAFFAPVATRFRTYQITLSAVAEAYCETIFADADFQDWDRAAAAEPWSIPATDALYA